MSESVENVQRIYTVDGSLSMTRKREMMVKEALLGMTLMRRNQTWGS
jgi:hypothetical protein